jgi:hypothetical protein
VKTLDPPVTIEAGRATTTTTAYRSMSTVLILIVRAVRKTGRNFLAPPQLDHKQQSFNNKKDFTTKYEAEQDKDEVTDEA